MTTRRRSIREAQFSDFARARTPQLYRSAVLLCGDRQRAEDLVQETLIKVYARWGPGVDNPVAYAHTVLTRTWISQMRRRGSHEPPVEQVPETAAATEDHALRLTLLAALDELEPIDRAIVVLRHLHDTPTADVARVLDLTPGAVRKRLHRALQRMRTHLDPSHTDLAHLGVLP